MFKSLNLFFGNEFIITMILRFMGFSLDPPMTSPECWKQMTIYGEALRAKEYWAFQFVDATAKPGDGVFDGNTKWVGSYDQCIALKVGNLTDNQTIAGGYFAIDLKPPESMKKTLDQTQRKNMAEKDFKITWGVCLPDICTEEDVKNMTMTPLNWISKYIDLKILNVRKVLHPNITKDTSAVVAIMCTGVYVLFIIICTVFAGILTNDNALPTIADIKQLKTLIVADPNLIVENCVDDRDVPECNGTLCKNKDGDQEVNDALLRSYSETESARDVQLRIEPTDQQISQKSKKEFKTEVRGVFGNLASCFSLLSNLTVILQDRAQESLSVLSGLRVLAMQWIVLGHSVAFIVPILSNPGRGFQYTKQLAFQTITTGPYLGCEAFFVLSGLLTTYVFCTNLDKQRGQIGIRGLIWYLVHRFIRVSPLFYMIIFYVTTLVTYVGTGPFWHETQAGLENCKKNAWFNLLYIHNFKPEHERCLPWTWFIACEMQFYLVAPLILIPLYKNPKIGYGMLLLMFSGSIGFTGYQQYLVQEEPGWKFKDIEDVVYVKPWARLASYTIGMSSGYLLYSTRQGKQISMSTISLVIGWLLACILGTIAIYFKYLKTINGELWTKPVAAAYETMSRPVWSLVVSWIIVTCSAGYGGIMNRFLSAHFFAVLSRLAYSMFFAHGIVIAVLAFNMRHTVYLSTYYIVQWYLANLLMGWLGALMCSMAYELPFRRLEKLLTGQNFLRVE